MTSILPFDELNRFEATLRERFADGKLAKEDEEDIIDEMLDLFLLAYAKGNSVTNANLSSDWMPTVDDVMKVVDEKVAGKTWRERVEDYFSKARNGEIPAFKAKGTTNQQKGSGESSAQSGLTDSVGSDSEIGGVSLPDAIIRIADTEMHRIANQAALDTAKYAGAKYKTWATMLDDKVRDTHDYLEGMTVGIDEDFYTYDGDHAPAPGLFELPENSINCRCELIFS